MAESIARMAAKVLGFTPPIDAPQPQAAAGGPELEFNVGRLAAMGFTWTNGLEAETRATLELCRAGERRWGRALFRRCRPDLEGA